MNPGRELDILIAKQVLGWEPPTPISSCTTWLAPGQGYRELPEFSYKIEAAMEVWGKLREKGCCLILNEDVEVPAWSVIVKGPRWRPGLTDDEHKVLAFTNSCDSMAHAICLAALKLF